METSQYFSSLKDKHVLVIGDINIDRYITGTASRISPDAPVPVLDVETTETYIGATGLIIKYILSLGGRVSLCTVIADDLEGGFILNDIQNLGVDLDGIYRTDGGTPQVTRIKARGQHLLRLEKKNELSQASRSKMNDLFLAIVSAPSDIDVIVLADYDEGLFSQNYTLINNIVALANERGIKIIARPEKANYQFFTGADIVKFNINLAMSIVGVNSINETSMRIISNRLVNELQSKSLFLAQVDGNSYSFDCAQEDRFDVIPSYLSHHGRSYVGSGSAQVAALALMTAGGAPLPVAARVAAMAGALAAAKPPLTFFSTIDLQEAFDHGSADQCEP
jgi:D-beta-D-heptose 7-phosphate kinase/D-beta-D-heptose 1-phosphate adenosyltransferase